MSTRDNLISADRIFNLVFDRETNALTVQLGSGSVALELKPGDIQLGAMELKDANSEFRAAIDALGRLAAIVDHLPSTGGEPFRVTVSDSPTKLLDANPARKKYFIQNLDEDNPIYIGGAAVTDISGLMTPAFGGFGDDMPYCGTEAVYAVASSGLSITVVVKEWQ
jgi:hypothetical protein